MRDVTVRCEDETCKHWECDYCTAKTIEMETERNINNQIVVVCKTYKDRREEDE